MNRRWRLYTAMPAAAAVLVAGGLAVLAGSSAGPPKPQAFLFCGMATPGTTANGVNGVSGKSDIDHFGASSTGQVYTTTGSKTPAATNCQAKKDGATAGDGMYTLSILHSAIHMTNESGTEHGEFVVTPKGGTAEPEAGFDGHVTNFDLSKNDMTGDACTSNRTIFYASGHIGSFDPASCSSDSVGNFDTHGGAQLGQHFRGAYGILIYQDSTAGSPCSGGSSYCFEAILEGQNN